MAWTQHNYHKNFDKFWDFEDNVDRVIENDLTIDEFIERYEKPYKPVIIQGVQNDWKANSKWTMPVSSFFFFVCYVTQF